MEHDDQDQFPAPAGAPQKPQKVTPASARESSSELSACGSQGSSVTSDPTVKPADATAFNFDAVEGLRAQLLAHAPEAIKQLAARNQWGAGELLQALQGLGDQSTAQSSADPQTSANDANSAMRRSAQVIAAPRKAAGTHFGDRGKSDLKALSDSDDTSKAYEPKDLQISKGPLQITSTEPQQIVVGTGGIAGTDMGGHSQDPSKISNACDEQPQQKPGDSQNSSAQQHKQQHRASATTASAAAKSSSRSGSNQDQQLVGVDGVIDNAAEILARICPSGEQ